MNLMKEKYVEQYKPCTLKEAMNNPELINILSNEFERIFFSCPINYERGIFHIKIKKTNMKRIEGYQHTSLFYSDYIDKNLNLSEEAINIIAEECSNPDIDMDIMNLLVKFSNYISIHCYLDNVVDIYI